jgi:hypothetical protein
MLRNAPELMDATKIGARATAHDFPGFHQRYIFDMAVHDRVLTKIGLNLVAKLLGLDLIRKPAFDAAVSYAREGKGAVYKLPPESSATFADMLGPAIPDCHSNGTFDLPERGLDFQRQQALNPARCHPTTVSGLTTASADRTSGNSR